MPEHGRQPPDPPPAQVENQGLLPGLDKGRVTPLLFLSRGPVRTPW